ncbi:MAG: tetratricopeptide repeat protein [Planctomycetes bacterium]|nr:tetratricopeptide repeat protein [Planctomycetota bacterium]
MPKRLFIFFLWLTVTAGPAQARPDLSAPTTAPATTRPTAEEREPEISPLVLRLIKDPATPPAERRRLAIFHGQWETLDAPTPAEQAAIALQRFELDDPIFSDKSVPAFTLATAAYWRGEAGRVIELTSDAEAAKDATVALLRARALDQLNRPSDAIAVLSPWRERLTKSAIDDAAQLAAAAEGIALLAQLEGRPAKDYHLAMDLLGKARDELDRMYWPALIGEARLLDEKDNAAEAAKAVVAALQLNPRSSEAWYMAGKLAVSGYDFTNANRHLQRLRNIARDNLLADMLEAEIMLTQKDLPGARAVLDPAVARYPEQRHLLALMAATEALAFNDKALNQTLARLEQLSPGSPEPYMTVGTYLSMARQYDAGEAMLRKAIERRPNWAEPRIELGLLLMQSGSEKKASRELHAAVALDTFHRRAANQSKLVDELLSYDQIETEHFTIRFHAGIDRVLAADMPEVLEGIYRDVTDAYGHKPARRTFIEIMPDEQWFAVRITGMPWLWTIGACTGDVIAITPPRDGPKQKGSYDWARVLRHEFTHTVTLDQTANRIPHWFTEACAVSQEPGGRDYNTCRLLAGALNANQLFALDKINWGFVRPTKPTDRPLAYAQAHWMVSYITATYGHSAIKELLGLYHDGMADTAALEKVTGRPAAQFMTEFKAWAAREVKSWGLDPRPGDAEIVKVVNTRPGPDPAALRELMERFPDHPEVLRARAEQAMHSSDPEAARAAVLRYAGARPTDPWPSRMLAALATRQHRTDELIGSLEALDSQEQKTGVWAYQLAGLYRSTGQIDAAAAAATRAVHLEAYNPTYRELTAALELQRGRPEEALRHVEALALLEPDKAASHVRLAALYARLNRPDDARAAAKRAKELDAAAPVDVYLNAKSP